MIKLLQPQFGKMTINDFNLNFKTRAGKLTRFAKWWKKSLKFLVEKMSKFDYEINVEKLSRPIGSTYNYVAKIAYFYEKLLQERKKLILI
jgi:hypothetical protein